MHLSCPLVSLSARGPHGTAGEILRQPFSINDAGKFLEEKKKKETEKDNI